MKVHIALAAAAIAVSSMTATATDFPDGKPITLILPFAPGGSVDGGFRIIVPGLEKELGTRIEIVNKGGAGGQSGITEFVRSAKPDGYTMVNIGLPTVMSQYLDPDRGTIYERASFQPVAQAWTGSYGIAVKADSPIKDLKQFIEEARARPGRLTVGDSGLMAAPHLMVSLFEGTAGVTIASVHFDGGSAANAALLGGHIEAMVGGANDWSAALQAGTVRMLGVATESERATLPGVPTMTSLGVPMIFQTIQGVAVPAGTPPEVVATLEAAFRKVLADPGIQKQMHERGNPADFASAADFAASWDKYEADIRPVMAKLLSENKK